MKVYFIGAGPGAEDLITVRGMRILERVSMVLYAGSLVPKGLLTYCRPEAEIVDTASLHLDEQEMLYRKAQEKGWEVARLHSGDPAIYGATAEQMRRLESLGIAYEIVPGVSSFLASAAALGVELTKPKISHTIILTRTEGKASPMPKRESIEELAQHGATMAVFLSGANLPQTIKDLLKHYDPQTPAALVRQVTWPEEKKWKGRLGTLLEEIDPQEWRLTTLLLVGEALSEAATDESRLYAADFSHRYRKRAKA